jgi:hypothetical protein
MTKLGPPGWEPHKIVTRLDGWFGSADRIPPRVAAAMGRQMPAIDDAIVADVKTRMACRQRMYERMGAFNE